MKAVENLLYRVDTGQGDWAGRLSRRQRRLQWREPALAEDFHILYAYATDGREATSTNTGQQSSPLI